MARINSGNLQSDNMTEKMVHIARVAKTTKGGKNFSFSALVVVGDKAGKIGFGLGKALEIQSAVQKAAKAAKRAMISVPLKEGRTLHHDMSAKFGAGEVIIRSAPAGTGVIAGGALRSVFECLGVQDVVSKSKGSNNPYNVVRAVFAAFGKMNSPKLVAARRGKSVAEINAARGGHVAKEAAAE